MGKSVGRLVFGLGNPGPEYEGTRHNVGFRVLDRMALDRGLLFSNSDSLEGYRGSRSFRFARSLDPDGLLVKPESWMNLSGEVAAPLVRWSGASPREVMVVYDDIDLPLGKLRIRPGGSAGGHRGMQSIIEHLETDRVPRLRVGIGRSTTDAARHVLARFSPKEEAEIEISAAEAAEAVLFWLREGNLEECMTRFHSRWNQDAAGKAGPHGQDEERKR